MDSRITQFLGHADTFTQRTTSLSPAQWACPSACEGWTAQDVLDHVIDTQREVFARHGMDLGARPSGAPADAWNAHAAAVRSAAADEKTLLARFDGPFGPTTLADVLLDFYGFDLIIHAWDIRRASGEDLKLTEAELDFIEAVIPAWGDALYQDQICGRPIEAPVDASRQARLLALTGRRSW